jgi:WD40 repeat protein
MSWITRIGWLAIAVALTVAIYNGTQRPERAPPPPPPAACTALTFDAQGTLFLGDGTGRFGPVGGARAMAHDGALRALLPTEDGGWWTVAAGSVARWAPDGAALGRWRLPEHRLNAAIPLDGGDLLMAAERGTVARVDSAGAIVWQAVGFHGKATFGLARSPSGEQVASVGADGRVASWGVADGKMIADWQAHRGWATGVAWRADGLITVGADGNLVRWRPDGTEINRQSTGHSKPITALAVDAERIATASLDGTVRIFARVLGAVQPRVLGDEITPKFTVVLRQQQVWAGLRDGVVRGWDVQTGALLSK